MNTLVQPKGITFCGNDIVEIAYSGTELGNTASRFEQIEGEADANLARLRLAVGTGVGAHALILAQQSADFLDLTGVSPADIEPEYKTDGIFTDSRNVVISLRPADCLNMVFYSANGESLLGLVHGGKGGVDGDIHLKAVQFMRDHGIAREAIRIFFGPAIAADSYYFKDVEPAQLADPRWMDHVTRKKHDDDKWYYHVDLQGRVLADLEKRACLQPSQLQTTEIDTGADPGYFSHARSHRATPQGLGEGRNGIVAKLR